MPNVKKRIQKAIARTAAEWSEIQPAWLGDFAGDVDSGTPGVYLARLLNGKVIKVYNTQNVPPTFDLHLQVGKNRNLPRIWQIIRVVEDYDTPAADGQIAYHHEQHMAGQGDMLPVDRKQIMQLTTFVYDAANWIVTVYGDAVMTANGLVQVQNQNIDLSSYVVTTGAQFVSIECDDNGTVTVHEGTVFGAPAIATIDDVPTPDPGKYLIAYILLYEGQTALADDDIHVPMPLGMPVKNAGLQISEATADTPADGDKFGFWDIVDGLLKSITFTNLKTLWFNDSEGQPADVTNGTPDDGTSAFAARRDHVHHVGQYRQFVYEVSGGDFSFVIDEDGEPVMALEDLE